MKINTSKTSTESILDLKLQSKTYTFIIQIPEDLNQFILMLKVGKNQYKMLSEDMKKGYNIE